MQVHRTENDGWLANAYLLDDDNGTGVLIDGNGVAGPLLDVIDDKGLAVAAVLLTHHHLDHVMIDEYKTLGAPILAHALTDQELEHVIVNQTLTDGDRLQFGLLQIECLHTPGHAHGHLAFNVDGSDVFTADVLFADSIGGTQAPQSTGIEDLRRSLRRIADLGPETRVHPGHGESTTIARERERNVFLRALLSDEVPTGEPCSVGGKPATLLLWGPDYDGSHKAWVQLADGTQHITGGSQVSRTGSS